ncbi:50S ribosomal protein L15 [Patescibacteria group bacterium]|nr:50S ribosomal protein L15 [Patescibacteria group bacterium]
MVKLHSLKKDSGSAKKRKRVGRGGATGTFCGKGCKGQKARSGYSRRRGFEGGRTSLSKQLPKLKGFKSFKKQAVPISLDILSKQYKDGELVTSTSLKKHNLIPSMSTPWKILNSGEISKKVVVKNGLVSKEAQKAIEAQGGEVTLSKK